MKKASMLVLLLGALSGQAVFANTVPTKMTFCTGGEGGAYEALGQDVGKAITRVTGAELQVLNTGGSVENAELMKDGECNIAVIQADVALTSPLPSDVKVTDAHVETVYWLHNKDGVDDFGKMEQDAIAEKYAVAAVTGSGALITVKNWVKTDKDYESVRVVEFEDWYSAAEAVAQGYVTRAGVRLEIAGMLYIARPGKITADITEDFSNQILIGEVLDDSFANSEDVNHNPLYTKCNIASEAYGGLKTSVFGRPETYCLRAQIVYNNDYHKDLDKADARKVRRAVDKGINSIVKAVR